LITKDTKDTLNNSISNTGPTSIQNVGPSFNRELYFSARNKTIEAINTLGQQLVEDINAKRHLNFSEADGHLMVNNLFKEMQIDRTWHPTKFRLGVDTTKNFSEASTPNLMLKTNDIFFIDVGPVIAGMEADYGRTFVVGDHQPFHTLAKDAERVFKEVANHWQTKKVNGMELYQFAANCAEKMGHQLNLKMDGHRLGDFPHALYFKGGLAEIEETPLPMLWILEIHLLSKDGSYGAFYEDLLL